MIRIANGLIIDGTGKAAFRGDIVLEGDRIAAVEPVAPDAAPATGRDVVDASSAVGADVVDATDCVVTPGFIDAHSHSDAYLVLEPDAPSKLSQGVTTEINGQCGGSVVPRYGEARLSGDWATLLGERLKRAFTSMTR